AIEALKKMTSPKAKVIRSGKLEVVDAENVVPGDIIVLSEGDRIPADARVIEAKNLQVDESPLTGESVPVPKDPDAVLPENTPPTQMSNMIFMGTHVVAGKGKAVVVRTGMSTEMGKIAKSLAEIKEEKTILERDLDKLGKKLGLVVLAISGVIFVTSITLERLGVIDSFILAVALAVAAVPESLPAVATTILALGAYRMAKRNAVVRELGAIESLGACDVIATDKTGTVTKGEMMVKKAWIAGFEVSVSGSGYDPAGEVSGEGVSWDSLENLSKYLLAHVSEDVSLEKEEGRWIVRGSPTEGAALVFALKVLRGRERARLRTVKVYPFDRFRKRKTTIHELGDDELLAVSSGAPELLLEVSTHYLLKGSVKPLSDEVRKEILGVIERYASQGFRTYGIACKKMPAGRLPEDPRDVEVDLVFIGVLGIIDPPREGVKEAIEEIRRAGVRVIMITGDHKLTAEAVAKMIGLIGDGGKVVEGKDLDGLSDEDFRKLVEEVSVYARVTPEHKRRIVEALKANGHVVAMTGDGVNDAPALKEADIGVAMGVRGTDVAKEVAKLVLKDDNFVTIVEAVKEGRVIYENLKKPINYLLPANIGEVTTILFAQLADLPTSLTAPQLLWINITTDSLPALALSAEPPEPDLMRKPPRGKKSSFITNRKLLYFTLLGATIGLVNLGLFIPSLKWLGVSGARTVVFAALAFSEFGRALASRSETLHFWWRPFNRWLPLALFASAVIQLAAIYLPFLNTFFDAVPLPPSFLILSLTTAIPLLLIDEVRKTAKIKL
ncbi:MAG: cation-transporting P-type ATPase, partial [Desulfurococcales archaeon]|nr:cation-transporting P-type ATPase [Desulfurococcales archaeon]